MMLLQWCTLEPTGPSQLAALRFSSPVRVRSVRVFPKHAQPFAEQLDIVSETEPEAFFLDVFFNAQPIATADTKQKQKATNALVPTVMAYAGGLVDFTVDMGNEFATRLMIVKGTFTKVSMAIYGDVVFELSPSPTSYTPVALPSIESSPLSPSIDPSNSSDPTALACQLLDSIPDPPPLPLVISLTLCLKPSSDDWDLSDFPYLHPDLDEETMNFTLEVAYDLLSRPVADDISYEMLQRFVDRVSDAIGPKSNDQAYVVAGILSRSASQNPELARLLLDRLDLRAIFDATTVDEGTLSRLLVACTNPDIARQFKAIYFHDVLLAVQSNASADASTKELAVSLDERMCGWDVLADALSNTQADFHTASEVLRSAGTDEPTFGVLLAALTSHGELVTRLADNPVLPRSLPHPPVIMQDDRVLGQVSHDEFVAFLRAFIGVSCVLAVYAYTDSMPHKHCRERALGILRVWQGIKGYREIVNRLLLLPQMIFRLSSMTENEDDEPTRAGIHAEHILLALTRTPTALLSTSLYKWILSTKPGLSVICEDERQDLRALAILAEDGLPAALEELMCPFESPSSIQAIRMFRVALAIASREFARGWEGEWRVLSTLWDEHGHGLALHLVDTVGIMSTDIQSLFTLTTPRRMAQDAVAGLFHAANEAMRVIHQLVPVYPLPGRQLRAMVGVAADLYACTDAADARYAQGSDACTAAQQMRQTCIDLVRTLAKPARGAEVVLRTLLQHGTCAGVRDPAYHLVQVFSLVDHLLPMPDRIDVDQTTEEDLVWIRQVIPRVLTELTHFVKFLDVEIRTHLIRRLADLDDGMVGIGEWLVLEELKQLRAALKALDSASVSEDLKLLLRYQVACSLRLLNDLVTGSSGTPRRIVKYIGTNAEAAGLMAKSFNLLLSGRMVSPAQFKLAETLVSAVSNELDPVLCFSLGLTFFRDVQYPKDPPISIPAALQYALQALKSISIKALDPNRLCLEVSEAFITLATTSITSDIVTNAEAEAMLSVMEWLVRQSHAGLPQLSTLSDISSDTFACLCDNLQGVLSPDHVDALETIRLTIDTGTEDRTIPPPALLAQHVAMSLHRVDALMRARVPPPSTPKRTTPPHTQNMLGLVTV
ncbi:hypothetical protein EW146_g7312, partial [Bondarzewia mesenterica]